MERTKKYDFNSFLIKSVHSTSQGFSTVGGDNEQEDIVYHYTSPDAFLSIIQNQAVRFTDIRYLNDKTEGIYFVKLLYMIRSKHHIMNGWLYRISSESSVASALMRK